jgi:hypothetical protein
MDAGRVSEAAGEFRDSRTDRHRNRATRRPSARTPEERHVVRGGRQQGLLLRGHS